jgi:very-short-patch-repair endonuclease
VVCPLEDVRGRGDAEVMRIAERQRGNVHRDQLLATGLGRRAIARRVGSRWLHPIWRDVYLVGRPRAERFGLAHAALLHLRTDALLCDATAAAAWDALEEEPPVVHVMLLRRNANHRPRLRLHRVTTLHPEDVATRHGLPVTSPARTILDRAGSVTPLVLENDIAEMTHRHGLTTKQIRAAIDRAPHASGVAILREILDRVERPARTRSEYERKLLALIRAAGLPAPRANHALLGYTVDFLWPQHRVIVEFDGYQFHRARAAFERDRERDARHTAAGYRVIRLTARMLDERPYEVIALLATALSAEAPSAVA